MKYNIIKQNSKLQSVKVFLFFFYGLYLAQGVLYPRGTILSQGFFVALIIVSVIYFFKFLLFNYGRSKFVILWSLFTVINIAGFLFTADLSDSLPLNMFRSILLTLLPFFPFYYLTLKKNLKASDFIFFSLVMLPIICIGYFLNEKTILENRISSKEEVVNNYVFSFISFLPYVFLFRKKILSYFFLAVLLFFIIDSAKRGAVIAGGATLILFLYSEIVSTEKVNSFRKYFFGIMISIALLALFYRIFSNNEFLLLRLQDMMQGNISGRDVIYEEIANAWLSANSFVNFLFGFGFAASLNITQGSFAHNDWLELLINFGLAGLLIYLSIIFQFIRFVSFKYLTKTGKVFLLSILINWLIMAGTARWYISINGLINVSIIAFSVGSIYLKSKSEKCNKNFLIK